MKRVTLQQGLTMVELLIGLTLSLILLLATTNLFVAQKGSYRTGTAVASLQDAGRIAMEIMTQDIRMAGYQGCSDPRLFTVQMVADGGEVTDIAADGIRGYETDVSGWASTASADIQSLADGSLGNGEVVAGTDVIALQFADGEAENLTADITATDNIPISDDYSLTIPLDAVFLLSDCDGADLVRRTNDPGSTGGALQHAIGTGDNVSALSRGYTTDAEVRRFYSNIYFVGPTGRTTTTGEDIEALFVRNIDSSTPTELLAGVENMQVVYGQQDASGNVRFYDADDVGFDMTQVVSVKLGLLLASNTSVREAVDEKSYTLAGTNVVPAGSSGVAFHPKDKQMRKAFNAMINIRNRRTEF